MNADNGQSFSIDWSLVRAQLQNLIVDTLRQGSEFKARFDRTLQEVQEELRHRPLEWGGPHYDLKKIRLTVCTGFRAGLMIRYGVHVESRNVFVNDIQRLREE